MNLHEYQAKLLFREFGIPVPDGRVADSVDTALTAARELGGDTWMVKAQVHAGGRGKAGGIQRVRGVNELRQVVEALLHKRLVTGQSGPEGQPVNRVLIERETDIVRELYLGALVDRERERIVFMASEAGGMDIEAVARSQPDKILTVEINPVSGLVPFQCRELAFALGLDGQVKALGQIMQGLYTLFLENDLSLVEINPLVVDADGNLIALDAKINLDDNALYRQSQLAGWRDAEQEDARERRAAEFGLNYVSLDGNIACMVNGAGLAMATMDLIKLHGGEPANFLDVGGGTTTDKVAEAFKLIISDSKVKAILVNIFGGIVRCDLIAEGIIQAVREVALAVPVIVRLEGTNAEQGRQRLEESGLAILPAAGLTDAAEKAVAAVGGQG
jgi:succinyl-CoA synthetase beta subunit